MIKSILIGRLGRDAEVKYTPQGKAVCNVSVACDVGWGDNKKTQWVDLTLWEDKAEKLAQYLTKGKQVYVEGTPSTRTWTDRNTGDARSALQVTVREIKLLGGGENKQQGSNAPDPEFDGPAHTPATPPSSTITDEDIPF